MNKKQLEELRIVMVDKLTEYGKTEFTCDNCPYLDDISNCEFVYDLYNTDGDCLAIK